MYCILTVTARRMEAMFSTAFVCLLESLFCLSVSTRRPCWKVMIGLW